jgi:hypothetical protein
MTAVSEDKYYEEHAALLGHVTLAWNDCHYMVLVIFHTLSGDGWERASATFFEQNSDHNRRAITRTLIKEVLNTKNDEPMREKTTELLDRLDRLAVERNLATHTIWRQVMPEGQVQPHPALPRSKELQEDFRSQFSRLTADLRHLLRELQVYEGGLQVHLEQTRKQRTGRGKA